MAPTCLRASPRGCWLWLASLLLAFGASRVQADGLGDKVVWQSGALLSDEFAEADPGLSDSLFERPQESEEDAGGESTDSLYKRYVDFIKRWHIDVVAPGRDLTKLMNLVSTKSRARFLEEREEYFQHLKVGTTSRPMLMAYLGLRLSGREELHEWLAQGSLVGPRRGRASRSCKSLLEEHNKHRPNGKRDRELLEHLKPLRARDQRHKFHLAHLTFGNNMNLFMLENFLILCNRLELTEPEAAEFRSHYEPLF